MIICLIDIQNKFLFLPRCITEEKINLSNSVNDNLEIFRREFLNANTGLREKEGVPIELLDKLTADELKIAEEELIKSARTWEILFDNRSRTY